MRRGFASLPLHYGRTPRWLFGRMTKLTRAIAEVIVAEYGALELLRRFSDPCWFQSLGCVVGFDWHSSGVTTTVCGALKEGLRGLEKDLGLYVCGGKGSASRRTPDEIRGHSEAFGLDADRLVRASRLSAKVDSTALQDGYQVYHHVFIGTSRGDWAVVQQGMNEESGWARRYHWLSEGLEDFVCEPHEGVVCDHRGEPLNMVAREAGASRDASARLAGDRPDVTLRELGRVRALSMPGRHPVLAADISPRYLRKVLLSTYAEPPGDFAELLLVPGVGPKTVRALALVAEVAHGARPSFRDPVAYSFAVGGKDGYPYPVDRAAYDRATCILERAVREAKLGRREQLMALRRLEAYYREPTGVPSPTGRSPSGRSQLP